MKTRSEASSRSRGANRHGEAYLVAAKALGLTELVEKFEHINREHDRLGELTDRLALERRSAYEQLLKEARKLLSSEQYDRLYKCF